MDVYVREFGSGNLSSHDEFYTNPVILSHFMNYTTQIVSRYKNSSAVFAWCVSVLLFFSVVESVFINREIANDPRYVVLCVIISYISSSI